MGTKATSASRLRGAGGRIGGAERETRSASDLQKIANASALNRSPPATQQPPGQPPSNIIDAPDGRQAAFPRSGHKNYFPSSWVSLLRNPLYAFERMILRCIGLVQGKTFWEAKGASPLTFGFRSCVASESWFERWCFACSIPGTRRSWKSNDFSLTRLDFLQGT